MEPTNESTPSPATPELPHYLIPTLDSLRKYTYFIGIVTWVGAGLLIIMGLFTAFFMNSLGSGLQEEVGFIGQLGGASIGLFYILIALLYYFPGKYLVETSKQIKQALRSQSPEEVYQTFQPLQRFFKFVGVIIMIVLILYGIIFLGALFLGGIGAFMS